MRLECHWQWLISLAEPNRSLLQLLIVSFAHLVIRVSLSLQFAKGPGWEGAGGFQTRIRRYRADIALEGPVIAKPIFYCRDIRFNKFPSEKRLQDKMSIHVCFRKSLSTWHNCFRNPRLGSFLAAALLEAFDMPMPFSTSYLHLSTRQLYRTMLNSGVLRV